MKNRKSPMAEALTPAGTTSTITVKRMANLVRGVGRETRPPLHQVSANR
jgi:hypothetical protein